MSPLRTELQNLIQVINKTDSHMDDLARQFWSEGGVCCPDCGCPEYSELMAKQERRHQRLRYLENKLENSSKNAKPSSEDSVEEGVSPLQTT